MIVYLTVAMICMVFSAYVSYVNGSERMKNKNINVLFFILYVSLAVALLLILGLRSDSVGLDTPNYKRIFFSHHNMSYESIKNMDIYKEPLFAFICTLFLKLGLSWNSFIMFMAALYIVPVSVFVYKKSSNRFWVMLFFVLGGSYLFALSAIRQAAAIGIVILAVMAEEKKWNLASILLILTASLIHVSAIVTLLYFVALKLKLTRKSMILWFAVGFCVAVFLNSILRNIMFDFLEEIDKGLYKQTDTGGLFREFYYIATLVIAFVFTDIFDTNNQGDLRYFKAIFLVAVILPIIRTNPAFFRIYMYFSIFEIMLVPQILSRLKMRELIPIATFGYVAVYLFFFYTNIQSAKLMEYSTYLV